MVSPQQCVLLLAAVLALTSSAYAVSCYQCESGFDERCGAEFNADSVFKVDCSRVPVPRFLQNLLPIKNATGCMKTVNEVSGVKHTTRSCYFGDIKGGNGCQSDPSLPYFKQISCDVCSDNYCNGASATGPIAVTVILFAAIARMLY